MVDGVIVAGHVDYKKELAQTLTHLNVNQINESDHDVVIDLLAQSHLGRQSKAIFLDSTPTWFPIAEIAVKQSQNLVLSGLHQCTSEQLYHLLQLAIESKSMLINADALMFNPVIYPNLEKIAQAEILTFTANKINAEIGYIDLLRYVEFLTFVNPSPLKNCFTKGVCLNGKELNIIHIRFEFENGSIALLEITNNKRPAIAHCEAIGNHNWLSLDLLTLNGEISYYKGQSKEFVDKEQIYPRERNAIYFVVDYFTDQTNNTSYSYNQFHNIIKAQDALADIEQQLQRSLPNFVRFQK